jgi:hypothetical protein
MLVVIHSKIDPWSFSTNRIVKNRRPIQHVDVVASSWTSKIESQNLVLWSAIASKITAGTPSLPRKMPFQAVGHFFHSQCMQSMDPRHPGNPAALPSSRILFIFIREPVYVLYTEFCGYLPQNYIQIEYIWYSPRQICLSISLSEYI